jgi:hypothetical protein
VECPEAWASGKRGCDPDRGEERDLNVAKNLMVFDS